jgi:apolipoprotein N-acyltransferase
MLVAMWSLAEWVYGHALTGFPWNLPGYAWTEFPWLIQSAAWIGIYGVTLLTLLAPALAALPGSPFVTVAQGYRAAGLGLAIVIVVLIAGAIRLPIGAMPTVPDVRLRLVQPSIQQSLKWVEGMYDANLKEKPPTFRDSIQVLDSGGAILATYDKFHYVPFGEYMPLGKYLPFIKAVAVGDIEPTPGPGPQTIRLPGLPPAGMLICYEVIFPNDVVNRKDRPDWLLDVTNDAWFGLSAGPYQHFAMMRVRSVEEGLPLANAANDGISGVVDPYGRVTARLSLGAIGVVDANLPKPLPPTFYSRVGDIPFFLMVAGLALAGVLLGRSRDDHSSTVR